MLTKLSRATSLYVSPAKNIHYLLVKDHQQTAQPETWTENQQHTFARGTLNSSGLLGSLLVPSY